MKPTEKSLKNIESQFKEEFRKNVKAAYDSGAVPDDADFGIVIKVVAYLTGNKFHPLSPDGKAILANLQHFI